MIIKPKKGKPYEVDNDEYYRIIDARSEYVNSKNDYDVLEDLDVEQAGRLVIQIWRYQSKNVRPDALLDEVSDDKNVKIALRSILKSFAAYEAKYVDSVIKGRENGKKGGRPPKKAEDDDEEESDDAVEIQTPSVVESLPALVVKPKSKDAICGEPVPHKVFIEYATSKGLNIRDASDLMIACNKKGWKDENGEPLEWDSVI